jgi:sugar lactone lactonase YvrE
MPELDNAVVAKEFSCALDIRAELGECPVWSAREQVLYWVDITGRSLNRYDPGTGDNVAFAMPADIGSFALLKTPGFLIALRSGIWLADGRGTLTRKIADAPYDPAFHRFNDGKCDRQGRFFVGSMNERRDAGTAGLWRVGTDLKVSRVLGGVTVSNGLAWSPDGLTMYHADTSSLSVRAFAYDPASGTLGDSRLFARWHAAADRPDGAAVDAAGNYWLALFRGGRVVQIAPSGSILSEFAVPAMCPTMCAFGGHDLRTLYVTTARRQRDAAELAALPYSGGIFSMRVEVPGLEEPCFGA